MDRFYLTNSTDLSVISQDFYSFKRLIVSIKKRRERKKITKKERELHTGLIHSYITTMYSFFF